MLTAKKTLLDGFANYTSADERALGIREVEEDSMDIVNDAIFMSYAPREPFTSVKVLETESRETYQRWFTNLPEEFQLRQRRAVTTPHVLMLQ